MKKTTRRLLGLFLAIVMIVGVLPTMALAASTGSIDVQVISTAGGSTEGAKVDIYTWNGSGWVFYQTYEVGSDNIAKVNLTGIDTVGVRATLSTEETGYTQNSITPIPSAEYKTEFGDGFLLIKGTPFAGAFSISVTPVAPPTPADVTVKFVVNDEVVATETGKPGDALSYPADPVLENYDFTGWDKNLTVFPDDAETFVTAQFTEKQPVVVEPTSGLGLFHVQVFDGTDYVTGVEVQLVVDGSVIGTGTTSGEYGIAAINVPEIAIGTEVTAVLNSQDYEYMNETADASVNAIADAEYNTTTASGKTLTVAELHEGKFCGAFLIKVSEVEKPVEPVKGTGLFHVQVFDGTEYISGVNVALVANGEVIGTGTTAGENGIAAINVADVEIGTEFTAVLDSQDYEYMHGDAASSVVAAADAEHETTTKSGSNKLTAVALENGKFCGAFAIWVNEVQKDTTAPVISLKDKQTVCIGTEFVVTDDVEVAEVRFNGKVITAQNGKFNVGSKTGTFTIVAKDTAGNETVITVTVANHNWNGGSYSCSYYHCGHHKCPGAKLCTYKYCTYKCFSHVCTNHVYGKCTVTYTCTRCGATSTDKVTCYPGPICKDVQPELNKNDHVAYVEGYGKGIFEPEDDVTRAEAATILYRLMTDCSRTYYKTTRNSFLDVGSASWYNTAVSTLDNAGIITDSNKGFFRPNEAITRAELAVMLRQFSTAKYTGPSSFTDVSKDHWAAREIAVVQDLGWIEGYPDNTFQPDDTLTRAEMVTMINRVLQRAVCKDGMLKGMKTFVDVTEDKWYFEDVLEAANGHTYKRTGHKVSGQAYYCEKWTKLF